MASPARMILCLLMVLAVAASVCGAAEQTDPPSFFVHEIITGPSEILSEDEICAVICPYEGKTVLLADLQRAVGALNELYAARGYMTARALLPPQEVEDGILTIQLVEGRVGEIVVEGNRHTRRSFLVDRMSLEPGDLVRLDDLERDLLVFNRVNDVQLSADISPGKDFGTTDLTLHVSEPALWSGTFFADNSGRGETGYINAGFDVTNSSLFGRRDPLTLGFAKSGGSMTGSASYDLSIGEDGTRLGLSFTRNQVDIAEGILEGVDVTGDSSHYSLTLNHPIVIESAFRAYGTLELHVNDSSTYFSGAELVASDVRSAVAGISNQWILADRVFSGTGRLTFGRAVTLNGDASQFNKLSGNMEWVRQLGRNSVQVRSTVQLAPTTSLPSSEQFSLGGMSTVRGVSQGMLTADSAYQVSMQLNQPVSDSTVIFTFVDHGGTLSFQGGGDNPPQVDRLLSVGYGADFRMWSRVRGTIAWGWPISPEHWPDPAFPGAVHVRMEAAW